MKYAEALRLAGVEAALKVAYDLGASDFTLDRMREAGLKAVVDFEPEVPYDDSLMEDEKWLKAL